MTPLTPYVLETTEPKSNNGMANKPLSITCPTVFVVEGSDDAYFLSKILKDQEASHVDNKIIIAGGKPQFKTMISNIKKTSGFEERTLKKIIIIRDADDNPATAAIESQQAFHSIHDSGLPPATLTETAYKTIIGYYIIPSHMERGELEDLCLSTVANPTLTLASLLYKTISDAQNVPLDNKSKRISRIYLACMPIRSCGVGHAFYDTNAFDHTAERLNDFKNFIGLVLSTPAP